MTNKANKFFYIANFNSSFGKNKKKQLIKLDLKGEELNKTNYHLLYA